MVSKYEITDIVVKKLGYKDVNACHFITKHKNDLEMITVHENQFFLTPKGLFSLLHLSDKQPAKDFRSFVIDMLC